MSMVSKRNALSKKGMKIIKKFGRKYPLFLVNFLLCWPKSLIWVTQLILLGKTSYWCLPWMDREFSWWYLTFFSLTYFSGFPWIPSVWVRWFSVGHRPRLAIKEPKERVLSQRTIIWWRKCHTPRSCFSWYQGLFCRSPSPGATKWKSGWLDLEWRRVPYSCEIGGGLTTSRMSWQFQDTAVLSLKFDQIPC